MEHRLKILIVEDSPEDIDLIERELGRSGFHFDSMTVSNRQQFESALADFQPDVILSDHSLPHFNSIEAMQIWRDHQKATNRRIPFILITGSVSEEFAVQSMKAGANDYILKDRLKRLPSSINSALEKCRIERERMDYMEEVVSQAALMREAEHLANFGSWQVDLVTGKHQWSDEAFRIFGFTPGEIEPDYEKFFRFVHPDDKEALKVVIQRAIDDMPFQECEYRIIDKAGNVKNLHSRILVKRDADQLAYELIGFTLDVTHQKKQTRELELRNQRLMEIAWVQSHEVRAPLARIMGLVQLIKRYPEEEADIRPTLNHIVQSANDLDEIIRKIVRKTEEMSG